MPRLETKHLLLIPFSLEMKRMTLRDKSRLADLIEAQVPEDWPGPDLLDALPFFIAQMEQHPADFVWDGLIVHKADRVLIGDIGLLTVAIFADLLYTFLIFWTRRRKGQWRRQNKSKSCFD